jgi:hypothetical protein
LTITVKSNLFLITLILINQLKSVEDLSNINDNILNNSREPETKMMTLMFCFRNNMRQTIWDKKFVESDLQILESKMNRQFGNYSRSRRALWSINKKMHMQKVISLWLVNSQDTILELAVLINDESFQSLFPW